MFGKGSEAHAGVRSALPWRRLTLVRSPRKRALTTSTVDRIPSTPHNDKPAAIRPFEPRIATLRRFQHILTACLATNDRLSAWREAFDRASHLTIFRCIAGDGISGRHTTSAETRTPTGTTAGGGGSGTAMDLCRRGVVASTVDSGWHGSRGRAYIQAERCQLYPASGDDAQVTANYA